MPIWTYGENQAYEGGPDRSYGFELLKVCVYCASPMLVLAGSPLPEKVGKGANAKIAELLGCPFCGWWCISSLVGAAPYLEYDAGFIELHQLPGVLKKLDLTDISTPTNELRSYLLARYSDRFDVHPKKYEDIVGGVFSDFGFRVRITSFSGDEGVDVFVLDGNDNATVGIQVKRYRDKISAEQIRAFVGALQLQGLTTGIFVTTSSYEKGARRTVARAEERLGIGISLLDAKQFYEALQITTRASHWSPEDPSAPYYKCWRDALTYVDDYFSGGWERSDWGKESGYVWGSSW